MGIALGKWQDCGHVFAVRVGVLAAGGGPVFVDAAPVIREVEEGARCRLQHEVAVLVAAEVLRLERSGPQPQPPCCPFDVAVAENGTRGAAAVCTGEAVRPLENFGVERVEAVVKVARRPGSEFAEGRLQRLAVCRRPGECAFLFR